MLSSYNSRVINCLLLKKKNDNSVVVIQGVKCCEISLAVRGKLESFGYENFSSI